MINLANVLDDAAILSLEHQVHLVDVLGEHSWQVNMQEQRFEFVGSHPLTCSRFHLLGSAAPGPRSWLWGWANPAGYSPELTALSAAVRDFGQQQGILELTSAEVPFDALPGSPSEPSQVAWIMTEAAKVIGGSWTSYTGDVGGGTRAAFLVEHPDFALPAPQPARTMRVLQQALAELPLTDARRALHSYATRRGLGATFSPDNTQLGLTGPGFEATIDFDQHNRIASINASMSSPA